MVRGDKNALVITCNNFSFFCMSDLRRSFFLLVTNTGQNSVISSQQLSQVESAEDKVVWVCCAGACNRYGEFSEPFNSKWHIHFLPS